MEFKDCGGEILFVGRFKFTINKAAKWFCDGDHGIILNFEGTDIFNKVYAKRYQQVECTSLHGPNSDVSMFCLYHYDSFVFHIPSNSKGFI